MVTSIKAALTNKKMHITVPPYCFAVFASRLVIKKYFLVIYLLGLDPVSQNNLSFCLKFSLNGDAKITLGTT